MADELKLFFFSLYCSLFFFFFDNLWTNVTFISTCKSYLFSWCWASWQKAEGVIWLSLCDERIISVLQNTLFLDTEFQKDVEWCNVQILIKLSEQMQKGDSWPCLVTTPQEGAKAQCPLWVVAVSLPRRGTCLSLGSHLWNLCLEFCFFSPFVSYPKECNRPSRSSDISQLFISHLQDWITTSSGNQPFKQ